MANNVFEDPSLKVMPLSDDLDALTTSDWGGGEIEVILDL